MFYDGGGGRWLCGASGLKCAFCLLTLILICSCGRYSGFGESGLGPARAVHVLLLVAFAHRPGYFSMFFF